MLSLLSHKYVSLVGFLVDVPVFRCVLVLIPRCLGDTLREINV